MNKSYLKLRWLFKVQLLSSAFFILLPSMAYTEDWPQAQGSNRDNKSAETELLDKWPEGGPELLWTFRNSGVGYSGPAVVGDCVYIMGGRNGLAELLAINATSGKLRWSKTVSQKIFDFEGF